MIRFYDLARVRVVAALFVDERGPYVGLRGVDPWGVTRDARLYPGPHPVVAHPPCERWGRYARGGPSAHGRYEIGDDGGCFAAALAAVRRHGGVLEHPADSHAWRAFDLTPPASWGGWTVADFFGGWTCRVDQSHFGHRARKSTWLYARSAWLPSLPWEPKEGTHLCGGASRARRKRYGDTRREITRRERHLTPPAFRDLLIQIARRA